MLWYVPTIEKALSFFSKKLQTMRKKKTQEVYLQTERQVKNCKFANIVVVELELEVYICPRFE